MYRYKNGNVRMELSQEARAKGHTMRANVNPAYITAMKRWNRESAAIIAEAIKRGDCKTAIREMQIAKRRNQNIRDKAAHHNKIVYDANGKMLYWWDEDEKSLYRIED